MDIKEYQKQLKEIENSLSKIEILKRQSGTIDIMYEKEIIPNSNQFFLMQLSDFKYDIEKIIKRIDWIATNTREKNQEDDY